MKDITIVTTIYCTLFIVLTLPSDVSYFGMSIPESNSLHHLAGHVIMWIGILYIAITGTMGAFARQDRFSLSQNHPAINRVLSLILMVSPFLAIIWDARFIYVLLGLLAFSHVKSKTPDEMKIEFSKSRAQSNIYLIILFTLAMMMMAWHDYQVGSIFDWGSTIETVEVGQNTDNA